MNSHRREPELAAAVEVGAPAGTAEELVCCDRSGWVSESYGISALCDRMPRAVNRGPIINAEGARAGGPCSSLLKATAHACLSTTNRQRSKPHAGRSHVF
jgi:hypothetical protein